MGSVISINHMSWSLSQPREEHAHLTTKDRSILSTEEEEMAKVFGDVPKAENVREHVTIKKNEIISSRSDEHNHPQNEAEIVASMAVKKMKQQVQNIKPVSAIYQRIITQRRSRCSLSTNTSLLKTALYRLQSKRLLPIPNLWRMGQD